MNYTTLRVSVETKKLLDKSYQRSYDLTISELILSKIAVSDCLGQVKDMKQVIKRGMSRLRSSIKEIKLNNGTSLSGDNKETFLTAIFFKGESISLDLK